MLMLIFCMNLCNVYRSDSLKLSFNIISFRNKTKKLFTSISLQIFFLFHTSLYNFEITLALYRALTQIFATNETSLLTLNISKTKSFSMLEIVGTGQHFKFSTVIPNRSMIPIYHNLRQCILIHPLKWVHFPVCIKKISKGQSLSCWDFSIFRMSIKY